MKYTKIDNAEEVASQSLKQEAAQEEEKAFQAEKSLEEMTALVARDLMQGVQVNLEKAKEDVMVLRKRADIFVKASGLTAGEVSSIRSGYLHRWVEHIERAHIQHSAVLKVKAELGEETASYDTILTSLDVSHDVAMKSLAEAEGRRLTQAERKVAPRVKK